MSARTILRRASHRALGKLFLGLLPGTLLGLGTTTALAQPEAANPPAAAAGAAIPSDIPLKREAPRESASPIRSLAWAGLAGAAALGVATVAARRRRLGLGSQPMPASIQRAGSLRLSPRHTLHVIHWEGRRLLVACGDSSMQLLTESVAGDGASEHSGHMAAQHPSIASKVARP